MSYDRGPSLYEIPAHLREAALVYHAASRSSPQVVSHRVYQLAVEYEVWLRAWHERNHR